MTKPNAPRESTDQTFNADVQASGITVVDFWATWCGPCRAFAPVFEQSAEQNPDVRHLKVDVDANPHLSEYFKVQSIPTTVFLRDGMLIGAIAGAIGAARLADLLQQTRDLDMEQVRAAERKK